MKALVYLESAKKVLEERPEPKNMASKDVIGAVLPRQRLKLTSASRHLPRDPPRRL
jgi:hypothetical protein